jgi:diguanylate cyclase (GGDEF)-like protein
MTNSTHRVRDRSGRPSPAGIRRWRLWSLRSEGIAFLLTTEALAVGLVLLAVPNAHLSGTDVGRLVLLAGLSAVYAELTDRVERIRGYLGTDRGVGAAQTSVVTFAGVLVLPTAGALLLVALVYAHTFIRVFRHKSAVPYRETFATAAVLLGTVAAAAVYHGLDGQLGNVGARDLAVVGLTLLTYTLTSLATLLTGMYLAIRPPSPWQLLPDPNEAAFELSTLMLGVLAGVIVVHTPWLTPLVFVLSAVLQRSSLVRQLQIAASTDVRTGLLNVGAWRAMADGELARSVRTHAPAALLLIDLDHFKTINDTHGHLAGDFVLEMIGHALKHELRDYDAVGRYGGEEFVVLLAGVEDELAAVIADRVRARIAALEPGDGIRVTASIGIAQRGAVADLDQLIADADIALYEAKRAGRDRVSARRRSPGPRGAGSAPS